MFFLVQPEWSNMPEVQLKGKVKLLYIDSLLGHVSLYVSLHTLRVLRFMCGIKIQKTSSSYSRMIWRRHIFLLDIMTTSHT